MPVIGILTTTAATPTPHAVAAFLEDLRDLGYVAGNNLPITFLGSANRPERPPRLAAELVEQRVDVIFCTGSEAAVAAKQATDSIPVVMLSKDPVGVGLVASNAHPGGNITGLESRLFGEEPALVHAVAQTLGRPASRTMEPANRPSIDGRSPARIFRPLRGSGAPRAILERIGRFHEDVSDF